MADIHDAAIEGDLATVNQLQEQDSSLLNQQDEYERTALMAAAWGVWRLEHGRCHRAVPFLREAVAILEQQNDANSQSDLVS